MNIKPTKLHVIEQATNRHILHPVTPNVPRVGEELRTRDGEYWKVITVVHVYDEPDSLYYRVNIGVRKIKT